MITDEQRTEKNTVREYIAGYLDRARAAQAILETYDQTTVDRLVQAIGRAVYDSAAELAELAVDETGMGTVADKTAKNRSKAAIIWNSLRGKPSIGVIERDAAAGIVLVAKPVGVVAAITPVTNPVVTPMSNAMFALKGRNAIIITPHHSAIRVSTETVRRINQALGELNAPADLVQILGQQSREHTKELIAAADVVVATGGAGVVQAAYSSGRPALGVGAGNVQCIMGTDADLNDAVPKIMAGRAFDNGIICSGEQSVIVPDSRFHEIMAEFARQGGYLLTDEADKQQLRECLFGRGSMNRHLIGQPPEAIARLAGFAIPDGTKVILAEAAGPGKADVLSREKMCPVLAVYRYGDFSEAVDIAEANLTLEGKGHSVAIHSQNSEQIEYAACRLSVSRFVINQICASSAGGSFQNGLAPTNTLGCGSWGHNSISENLTYKHLLNISRIAYFMPDNPVPTEEELWRPVD